MYNHKMLPLPMAQESLPAEAIDFRERVKADACDAYEERIDDGVKNALDRNASPKREHHSLTAYFKTISKTTRLTADEEVRLAQAIQAGKKTRWQILAAVPAVTEHILTFLKPLLKSPEYVQTVLDPSVSPKRHVPQTVYRRLLRTLHQIKVLHKHAQALRAAQDTKRRPALERALAARLSRIPWHEAQVTAFLALMRDLNEQRRHLDSPSAIWRFRTRAGCGPERFAALYQALDSNETELARAKEQFVMSNLRLVLSIAFRYRAPGFELNDLLQEGNLGLIRAVERFDPRKGFRFSTYATWWIRQALHRAIANKSRLIRLPAHIHELKWHGHRVIRRFIRAHGRQPTIPELAARLHMPVRRLEQLMRQTGDIVSLDAPLMNGEIDVKHRVADTGAERPDHRFQQQELEEKIAAALRRLPPREAEVVRRRFGLPPYDREHTLEEIGAIFGLTRERIRQIERRALQRLRFSPAGVVLRSFAR